MKTSAAPPAPAMDRPWTRSASGRSWRRSAARWLSAPPFTSRSGSRPASPNQHPQLGEQLVAAGHVQPLTYPRDVMLDGLGGDEQTLPDLAVGQSGQDEFGDLAFPVAEHGRGGWLGGQLPGVRYIVHRGRGRA